LFPPSVSSRALLLLPAHGFGAQEVQLQVQHAAEMDAVHKRLHEVLARKDATITELRAELESTLAQLHQATQELMGED
jgi:hypothetical protein